MLFSLRWGLLHLRRGGGIGEGQLGRFLLTRTGENSRRGSDGEGGGRDEEGKGEGDHCLRVEGIE